MSTGEQSSASCAFKESSELRELSERTQSLSGRKARQQILASALIAVSDRHCVFSFACFVFQKMV